MNIPKGIVVEDRGSRKSRKRAAALQPRYTRHGQHDLWSFSRRIIWSFVRTLTSGNVPDFWQRNAYQRRHPREPRSGRQLLAPPNATQVFRLVFESVIRYGLASVGVFLISVAPVTEKGKHGKTWEVFAEVIIGIVLLGTGAVFLVYPWVWKVRRALQMKDLELDKESHTDGDGNEDLTWETRRKNFIRTDKNDLEVTQSLFGAFANMMFAILINPKPEEFASLAGCVAISLAAAAWSRRQLSKGMEKASIQLRLLERTKLVWEGAIEQVSNQYRMYEAVSFGLLAGLLSVAASIIRRALGDHSTSRFKDDMATYIGPSAFNSIALSGALVYFARALHEQAFHVAVIEADDTRIFMEARMREGHKQTAQGESEEELHLLAEVAGTEIHVYEQRLGPEPKVYSPRPATAVDSNGAQKDKIHRNTFKFGWERKSGGKQLSQDTLVDRHGKGSTEADIKTGEAVEGEDDGAVKREVGSEDGGAGDGSLSQALARKPSAEPPTAETTTQLRGTMSEALSPGPVTMFEPVRQESSGESKGTNNDNAEPRNDINMKILVLYRTWDGFRAIKQRDLPKFNKAEDNAVGEFYRRLNNEFRPLVNGNPWGYSIPGLDETKPILKHIRRIDQHSCFARSSYECMALACPKLKREKWLLRPTRRKMAARLRGDVADLRTWLEMQLPLWQYKPSDNHAQVRKDATSYNNVIIGQVGRWVDYPAVSIAAVELEHYIRVWHHPVPNTVVDMTRLRLVGSFGNSSHPPLNLSFHEKHYEPLMAIDGIDLASNEEIDFDRRLKPADTIGLGDCLFHSLLYLINHENYRTLGREQKKVLVGILRQRIRARGVELVKVDSELAEAAQRCFLDEYDSQVKLLCQKIRNGRWKEIMFS